MLDPAPPRPAPRKNGLPRPAKSKIAQIMPTHLGLNGEINEMKEKLLIWSFVQLVIIWLAERPFKSQRM